MWSVVGCSSYAIPSRCPMAPAFHGETEIPWELQVGHIPQTGSDLFSQFGVGGRERRVTRGSEGLGRKGGCEEGIRSREGGGRMREGGRERGGGGRGRRWWKVASDLFLVPAVTEYLLLAICFSKLNVMGCDMPLLCMDTVVLVFPLFS